MRPPEEPRAAAPRPVLEPPRPMREPPREDGMRHVNCMAGITTKSGALLCVLRVKPLCIIQQINPDGDEDGRIVLQSDAEIDWLVRSLKLLRQE